MKRAQPLSTINKKLTSVPELPYKKGLLNSSPKPKEKRNAKSQYDKIEPMVLRSPPTGESVVRYALPIPSSKTKELIAEDEMVRRITKHLKMVVTALENTYGTVDEDGENTLTKPKEEGISLSVGDDMNAFLQYCSQFAAQMEEAVKEERNILESLFKWFQQQVNQIEEIGKDQSILEGDLPPNEKTLNLNIAQIVRLVHRLEDLKTRLKGRKGSLLSKHAEKDMLPGSMRSYEAIEKQIEGFINSHSAYKSQVASETEPGAPYSVTKRMNMMMKIFENQTNMLERALNDQSIVETKYKQMETDFQMLLLEKTLLESEIQRMRESEAQGCCTDCSSPCRKQTASETQDCCWSCAEACDFPLPSPAHYLDACCPHPSEAGWAPPCPQCCPLCDCACACQLPDCQSLNCLCFEIKLR